MTKDMTTGSPAKHIVAFTLPLMLGNIFQQLYSMVDTMIVGRTMGQEALGGVGSTGAVMFMVMGLCMGFATGCSIPVAQEFGARDFKNLRRYVGNMIWLVGAIAVVFTALTMIFCGGILKAMNTPGDIYGYAYDYLIVMFLGLPVAMLYNSLSSLMRALGDSVTPVVFLTIAAVLNVGLDLLFILVFDSGVSGAAWATVISQGVSCAGCFIVILKRFDVLRISRRDMKLSGRHLKRLTAMGLPMGLQFCITAIGSVMLQTSVNALGAVYVSAITAASKISMLFTCVFDSMGATMSTYGGQNIGAGRLDRIRRGLRAVLVMSAVYAVISLVLCWLLNRPMIGLFVDRPDNQIVDLANRYLITSSVFYMAVGIVNIFRLLIQGLGFARIAMLAGVLEMIGRGVVGLVFIPAVGFAAACYSGPIAWILADLFLVPAYFRVMKRLEREIPAKKPEDIEAEIQAEAMERAGALNSEFEVRSSE